MSLPSLVTDKLDTRDPAIAVPIIIIMKSTPAICFIDFTL